jgi:hypothetical protein
MIITIIHIKIKMQNTLAEFQTLHIKKSFTVTVLIMWSPTRLLWSKLIRTEVYKFSKNLEATWTF